MRPLAPSLSIPLLLAGLLAGCAPEGGSGVQSAKLSAIQGRGKLICGVDGKLPGFSFVGPDGTYTGLDVDVCKAVAAAVFAVIHSRAPTGISPIAPQEEFFFQKKIAWDPLAPGTQ